MRIVVTALLLALPFTLQAEEIQCPGEYDGHLQGIALDDAGNIYWCFTVSLVKTGPQGGLIVAVDVPTHHGDLWVEGGVVHVAVNHPKEGGGVLDRESWIYAYAADDLAFAWKKPVPEVTTGAGGIAMRDGHFFLASGRVMQRREDNTIYEYDPEGVFLRAHVLRSGPTQLGIQTIAHADGAWWFGCYGTPPLAIRARDDFSTVERLEMACALGVAPAPGGGLYLGRGERTPDKKHRGWLVKAEAPAPPANE